MTLERWRRLTEWPTLAAALVFLGAYSVQVIANLRDEEGMWAEALVWVAWGVFVLDYGGQLVLAPQRGRWFARNLHELAILALPALRPLRLLRLVTFLRVVHNKAGSALRGRLLLYVVGSAAMIIYCGALAAEDVEQNEPGANIRSFGDAIWWALETITTVGYGDRYPVTIAGRFVAAGLMMAGIAVLGVVTASIAAWLVESVSAQTAAEVEAEVAEVEAEVEAIDESLEAKVEALTEQVARLAAALEERQRNSEPA
ncbi:ion channel [Sinomonas sp. ASV322]|uniref:ion channel n=1 Tax=Sinomonas sp. ASV322 TaxID=3041920 RepID=UPI0027DAF112|nr:ion channel [Sinomonas sp. ASV322]MDQ4504267.1 ion channel [Sinomonas sp. ASV322]